MAAKLKKVKNQLTNEDGLATIEALPLIVIFLVLITYGLGLFGVVHTGILNSISARSYAFETFRHRTNLTYFHDQVSSSGNHQPHGFRYHAIAALDNSSSDLSFKSVVRPVVFGRAIDWAPPGQTANVADHNEKIYQINRSRNREVSVSPAWVKVGYGICLNATCGNN